jgi:hypothetical protein
VIGGGGNIITGVAAMSVQSHIEGALIGAIAGVVFMLVALGLRRVTPALSRGMLCGGCIIALIGGGCGASLVGTTFH